MKIKIKEENLTALKQMAIGVAFLGSILFTVVSLCLFYMGELEDNNTPLYAFLLIIVSGTFVARSHNECEYARRYPN